MTLGEKIKFERKKLKISFKNLSELTGIPVPTLKAYENGQVKNISHERLILLAKIFDKDINYFLLGNETDNIMTENSLITIFSSLSEAILGALLEKENVEELLKFIEDYIKNHKKNK